MTLTRKQYMAGECTHDQYYDQFVTQELKNILLRSIPEQQIVMSKHPHFDDIPLTVWDWIARIEPVPRLSLEAVGDSSSLGTQVCALKEAARQIREGSDGRPISTYL
jgi:hypothetical protein